MSDKEYNSFAEYLYIDRLNWVKHVIPVSYFDSSLQLLLEAYITNVVKKVEDEEDNEEEQEIEIDLSKKINIRLAFMSLKASTNLVVSISDIYPSNRNLTKIDKESDKEEVKLIPIYPDNVSNFKFSAQLDICNLNNIYQAFPDITWTKFELASMVNRPVEDITDYINNNLEIASNRICKITNMPTDVFKLKQVEYKDQIIVNENTSHKIANSIENLYTNYKDCQECELGVKRKNRGCNIVPSKGNNKDPIYFIIGEAPGGQEEEQGYPFNPEAPAGGLLASMLKEAGIEEQYCYWTNAVICRPEQENNKPGLNGKPTNKQINSCNSRLKNELALLHPKIVIILGKSAYRSFFGTDPENVVRSAGWITTSTRFKVYFLPHPSFVIRQMAMAKNEGKELVKQEYLNQFKEIKNAI